MKRDTTEPRLSDKEDDAEATKAESASEDSKVADNVTV